jgi:hypothetical protein
VFGLGLLLQLPITVAALALIAMIAVPIAGPLMRGGRTDPALILGPICGGLAIGIPVLLVGGLVLGIMYITALRFIMLDGMPTVHAAGESWRMFRARFSDHALMYLVSIGLNLAAGIVLAIPIVVVSLVTIVPAAIAASSRSWGMFGGLLGVFALLAFVLGLLYSALWGTFTSALWTIFFRRLTGREVLAPQPGAYPPPVPGAPMPETPPGPPAPPMYAPAPPASSAPPVYAPAPPASPEPPAQPPAAAPDAPSAAQPGQDAPYA